LRAAFRSQASGSRQGRRHTASSSTGAKPAKMLSVGSLAHNASATSAAKPPSTNFQSNQPKHDFMAFSTVYSFQEITKPALSATTLAKLALYEAFHRFAASDPQPQWAVCWGHLEAEGEKRTASPLVCDK